MPPISHSRYQGGSQKNPADPIAGGEEQQDHERHDQRNRARPSRAPTGRRRSRPPLRASPMRSLHPQAPPRRARRSPPAGHPPGRSSRSRAPLSRGGCARAHSCASSSARRRLGLAVGLLEALLAGERLERRRRERAAAGRGGEPRSPGQRQQRREHARRVLVLEDAHDQRQLGRPSERAPAATRPARSAASGLCAPSSTVSGSVGHHLDASRHAALASAASRTASSRTAIPASARYASAATRARAKLRCWKTGVERRRGEAPRRTPGRCARAARAATARARASASGSSGRAERERRFGTQHRELLGRDVAHGGPQPAGVLEAHVGEHRHRRRRPPRWRRSGRRGRPRPPPPRPRCSAKRPEGGGGEQLELGDVVVLGERVVDALRRPRRARDGGREGSGWRCRARPPAPVRRRRSGGVRGRRRCAARGARGSPRSCAWSRSSRWCPPRAPCESAAAGSPARSSSAASGRGRSASRTAPASAGGARRARRSRTRSQRLQLAAAGARAWRARPRRPPPARCSHEAGVGELPSTRAISPSSFARAAARRRSAAARSRPLGGEHLDRAARARRSTPPVHRCGRHPRARRRARLREDRRGGLVPLGVNPRGRRALPGGRIHAVAPAAHERDRLDRRAPARSRRRGSISVGIGPRVGGCPRAAPGIDPDTTTAPR